MSDAVTPITPEGLSKLSLPRAFRGYEPETVDRVVQEIATSLESLGKERDELRGRVRTLEQELTENRETEHLMKDALLAAQRAADDLRERTRLECDELLAKARADADEVERRSRLEFEETEARVALLRKQEQELRASYRVLLHAALERLEQQGEGDEPRATLIDALAPRRPAAAETGGDSAQPPSPA